MPNPLRLKINLHMVGVKALFLKHCKLAECPFLTLKRAYMNCVRKYFRFIGGGFFGMYISEYYAKQGKDSLAKNNINEAIAILESQTLLANTMRTLRTKCIDGITVNEDNLATDIERTVGIVTALNPVIGYEAATELAKEAYETDKGILELLREKKILTDEQIEEILNPAALSGLDPKNYQ